MFNYATLFSRAKKEECFDGKVWIENKKVLVMDERGLGVKPTIYPREGVKIFVNGKEHTNPVAVSQYDHIELHTETIIREEKIEITFSQDHTEAYLHTIPAQRIRVEIIDCEPETELKIKTFEIIENVRFISEQDILRKINSANISVGINFKNIDVACNTFEEKKLLIASGTPVQYSQDSVIEYFFPEGAYAINLHEIRNKIDYKNTVDYNSSDVGDILAVKHSFKKGVPGLSVEGKLLQPKKPLDYTLVAGYGIEIEEDGKIARCTRPGKAKRTVIEENKVLISIDEELPVKDDVDFKFGNIHFKGNIDINGSIKEAMEINAGGFVNIKGDSFFAFIKSASGISIKRNTISSHIETKTFPVPDKNILKYAPPVIEELDSIINTIKEEKISTDKINEYFKSRIPVFNQKVRNLVVKLKNVSCENPNEKIQHIIGILKSLTTKNYTISSLDDLYYVKAIITGIKFLATESLPGDITLSYVANSTISASGNVEIASKGCINSVISAKGKVKISGNVRGGKIYSDKEIELNIVGSETSASTIISVPVNGVIKISKVMNDSVIKIGSFTHRFIEPDSNINARIVNNKLVLR